jgi:hypothetical protein
MAAQPTFSQTVTTSAYVFKLVRGRVKSLEFQRLANDPVATFLYPQNKETGKP